MEAFPKAQSKEWKGSTGSEKLAQAIKKAKYERARKAVNDSFDRSIGSLRRRRQKKESALNQSFAIKQAATLKLKNKEIIMALARVKQYCSQLEKINYYFKQQQMALAMKVASYTRRLKTLSDDYQSLKEHSDLKDGLLLSLRQQLTSSLDAIDCIQNSDNKSLPVPTDSVPLQPMRVVRDTSKRDSEVSTCSETAEVENVNKLEAGSALDRVLQSPSLPVLMEEPGQVQEKSFLAITTDVFNVGSENLDFSKCTELMEEPGQVQEKSFLDITQDVLNVGSGNLDFAKCAELMEEPGQVQEKSFLDITLTQDVLNAGSRNLDFSKCAESLDSKCSEFEREAGSEHTESGNSDINDDDITENLTNHDTVSMELTDTSVIGLVNEEIQKDNADAVEKNAEISDQTLENVTLEATKSSGMTMIVQKRSQARPKTKKPAGKISKKKACVDSTNRSSFDFLSCSSDSFVRDTEKRVKLNCTKSLSPKNTLQLKNLAKGRFSQPATESNDENSEPAGRTVRRRAAGIVSYAEPTLKSKLRRGDQIADASLYPSFSPKRKSGRKKILK